MSPPSKMKKKILFTIFHHHHDVRIARISLTLSLHVSLSFIASGRSSGLHPISSHSCCMNVQAGRPAFAWPYAGVHRSTSLTISSLLLQSDIWKKRLRDIRKNFNSFFICILACMLNSKIYFWYKYKTTKKRPKKKKLNLIEKHIYSIHNMESY